MIKMDDSFKKTGAIRGGELPDGYSLHEETTAQDEDAKDDNTATNDAVKQYLREIEQIHPLSSEEANALWEAKQRGDSAARDRIIEANLFLVINIVKKYKDKGVEEIDLIGAGNCGLVNAVDNYNQMLGYSFSTYAHKCIRNEIKKAFEGSKPLKISEEDYRLKKQADEERERLEQRSGKSITNTELAKSLGWSPSKLERVLIIWDAFPLPLNADSNAEDPTDGLGNLPDPEQEDPQDTLVKTSMQHEVEESLEVLTAQEKAVIKLVYGMYDGIQHKYSDIERMLDLRKGTAKQIEHRGLEKLRDYRVLIKLIAYSKDRSIVDWADSLQSVKTKRDPR